MALGLAAQAQETLANGLVAIVNDSVITWKDLLDYTFNTENLLRRQYGSRPSVLEQKIQETRREGLKHLVERKLILHEFKTAGYNLPESIIEDRVRERIREQYGDRLNLTRSLQAENVTFETWRQQIKENFIISVMRSRNISQEIIMSPHKIEKYYAENRDKFKLEDQVKVRDIVINQSTNSVPGAARKVAEEIVAKLNEGAPFAEMATIYSEDSYRSKGGDRGWVERKVLRKELADAVSTLQPGQHSGVVDTPDACYIVLVEETQGNRTKTLPEVRDEIERTLVEQEQGRLNGEWIKRLEAKSFVRYF